MSQLGKIVQLKGLTSKGKNRVRENGDRWTVLAETDRVLFSPNESGPWLFMTPRGCDQNHKSARWVRAVGDTDFVVVAADDLS